MASVTYTSFPPVIDESPSPVLVPIDHLSGRDTPTLSIDMHRLEISDTAAEDEDFATSLTPLDCAGYHLAPITPTKERSRRATMPEPSKHRPQDVPIPVVTSPYPSSFFSSCSSPASSFPCTSVRSFVLTSVDRSHLPSPNSKLQLENPTINSSPHNSS
jgi:hypothetical protein